MARRKSRTDLSSDLSANRDPTQVWEDLHFYENDAFMLFQDLCHLTAGESGVFLKVPAMQKVVGLELIESVLGSAWELFPLVSSSKTHILI